MRNKHVEQQTTVAALPPELRQLATKIWRGTKTQGLKKTVHLSHSVDGQPHCSSVNLVRLPDSYFGSTQIRTLGELRNLFQPDEQPETQIPTNRATGTKWVRGTPEFLIESTHWQGDDGEGRSATTIYCPYVEATASLGSGTRSGGARIYVHVFHQRPLTLKEAMLFGEVGYDAEDRVAFDEAFTRGDLSGESEEFADHLVGMMLKPYRYAKVFPLLPDHDGDHRLATPEEIKNPKLCEPYSVVWNERGYLTNLGPFGIDRTDAEEAELKRRFPVLRERAYHIASEATELPTQPTQTTTEEQEKVRKALPYNVSYTGPARRVPTESRTQIEWLESMGAL